MKVMQSDEFIVTSEFDGSIVVESKKQPEIKILIVFTDDGMEICTLGEDAIARIEIGQPGMLPDRPIRVLKRDSA